eukprot:TRINITY_DN289_c0_g1_i8.p1 TRINITY_DN289_c0_g1~~TRINITY_DN289_c0_g1_i8.p1  ORF type:complete len:301 (+),score=140.96 TRINITY_DN289_c0_g1_i8:70-972(+)
MVQNRDTESLLPPESKSGTSYFSKEQRGLAPAVTGRGDNASRVSESILNEGVIPCCGCNWSRNARTFMLSFVLFTTITCAQTAGALIANSMALLADCASMALDAFTYAVNISAECRPEPDARKKQRNQLLASGFSFFALFGITVYFLQDAVSTVISGDFSDDDVNAYIVFAFAVAGLTFDLLCLAPYFLYGCPCFKGKAAEDDDVDADSEQMNLCSALMHVSADLMRSTTTFVESILIWAYGINGSKCDAYATVIVSSTILLGLLKPIFDWFVDLHAFCSAPEEDAAQRHGVDTLNDREE